ncbi:ATP-binding cassette domain-containing protein [Corynebacterium lubricantis]|uniref:ATP-binding cassette domain-containing protein n=1 Tax=Corynebacterium lubricantis TaxID=541095 RepID=UPI0003703C94|nr:ATP-binding cassette domain-containing protein [Corynebacterium lubricantis]
MLQPTHIEVRGARVNNLKNIDVDIPLGQLVAIAGVSGSGKSSLAMGVLYAEGSRRYIEALSTYTRRRMSHAPRADVDRVTHVPAALALRQRPSVPDVRSTFGTTTELLNVIRLIFSRLARHKCPNGHYNEPSLNVAAEKPVTCATCGVQFNPPGAEDLAFNSDGACPTCEGLGTIREVDDASLIRDPAQSIDEGTVLPWQTFGFNVQPDIVREFGVRTDVAWQDLEDWERDIVLDGPEEKKHITVTTKKGVHDLDFTFRNARLTVTEELKRADNDKRLAKVARFLTERTCPSCHGTRLSEEARTPLIDDSSLADVTALTLREVMDWAEHVPETVPEPMSKMALTLADTLTHMGARLVELGLSYLSLDRAGNTLSTGERQRVQLARAVRNETTGVLYVLDEPSIGLHPSNLEGLHGVIRDLLSGGNSVVMVDHDPRVLAEADHLIEIGPASGRHGGEVTAQGSIEEVSNSLIGGYITGRTTVNAREPLGPADDHIHITTTPLHTVHALDVKLPVGRMTTVTGVSGSGKTTLVLDSLVPALQGKEPAHVSSISNGGIATVHVVDATPIGANVRSTVGTYTGVLDQLRREYAKVSGLKAGDFSFNTGKLKCPECEGTGKISLDVQFLPDVDITCPECGGSRYSPEASEYRRGGLALPELLAMTIDEALEHTADLAKVHRTLQAMSDVGLGYLTLNEATPALSGGEAQRLKLVGELHHKQESALFVFDEPTVGLHPQDVATLIGVLQRLIDKGATVLVIEHDLDLIRNSDYLIDLGPGGGVDGGQIVATGTPEEVAANSESVTGRYLGE